jgi:hypothetical protein
VYAYHLIEIAERLDAVTKRCIEPILSLDCLSESVKAEARTLINRAQTLAEQISESPDIDYLHVGIGCFRADVENFIRTCRLLR